MLLVCTAQMLVFRWAIWLLRHFHSKIPNIDAASILGTCYPLFSCFLLWALFLSFSFTHMTVLCCYLKLPLSVGGEDVCVWIFCCIPPPFPHYLLPSTFHLSLPPFFLLLSLLARWMLRDFEGLQEFGGWWRLENYLLLVWVAAAQMTLHLTAIFPPAFFRLGIVSRQR